MNIESEYLDDHQVKLTVQIEQTQFDQARQRAARKLSRRTKIPGFRPGKAPFPVIQRYIGEAAIVEEALDNLIDEIYPQVIEESGIDPYGPGSLEEIQSTEPPVLDFVVPLTPEVTLGDYQSIRSPYEYEGVNEDDVQEVLKQIQENQAIVQSVERPATDGDIVYIQIQGERIDPTGDEPEQEETPALLIPERRLNVLIESQEEADEWPFPGFALELKGLSAGESKKIKFEYPDEDQFDELKGAHVRFTVSVEEVVSRELPELNDELAQAAGEYENLEELIEYIQTSLEESKHNAYDEEYTGEILERIIEESTIKFPPQMVEFEIDSMVRQLASQLGSQRLDLDTYLKSRGMEEAGLREEMQPVAEQRIRRGLVLMEIAEAEEIQVDQEKTESELNETLESIYGPAEDRKEGERISPQAYQSLVMQMMNDRLVEQTEARLRQIATDQTEIEPEPGESDEPESPPEDSSSPEEPTSEPAEEESDSQGQPDSPDPSQTNEDALEAETAAVVSEGAPTKVEASQEEEAESE